MRQDSTNGYGKMRVFGEADTTNDTKSKAYKL